MSENGAPTPAPRAYAPRTAAPALAASITQAPLRRVLSVGAADDPAEVDADRRADAALGWLAAQQPAAESAAEPHVHTAACDVGRRHAPDAAGTATIGAAGGDLDAATNDEIESARGGGETLAAPVRREMEAAFGTDLGRVRVHRGASADRLSRSMSAEAFTTGDDVFFSAGAYAPETPRGKRVLAHELGHVMQRPGAVHRLDWFKSPEEKKRAKELKAAEAVREKQEKDAKAAAKLNNAAFEAMSKKVKLSYQAADGPVQTMPAEAVAEFHLLRDHLAKERQALAAVAPGPAAGEQLTGQAKEDYEKRRAAATAAVWEAAPPEVRKLRPLRVDDFDKALNEVGALAAQGRQQLAALVEARMVENARTQGASLSREQVEAQILSERALQRRADRTASEQRPEQSAADQATKTSAADAKVAGARAGSPSVGPRQVADVRQRAGAVHDQDTHGAGLTGTVGGGFKAGAKATGRAGKAVDKPLSGLTKVGAVSKSDQDVQVTGLVTTSTSGLSQLMSLISNVLGFATQVKDIRSGKADKNAGTQAAATAAGGLKDAADVAKTAMTAIQDGLKAFEPVGNPILDTLKAQLPIVGIITSSLSLIEGTIRLTPTLDRHAAGVLGNEEAMLEGKFPLATSYDRMTSRTAQLIEKTVFGIGKDAATIATQVADVVSAGFALPAAASARIGISVLNMCHSAGHLIYDTVREHQAAGAKQAFGVEHQEGASRDVLKYDIGNSVDVLIVAAKSKGTLHAIMTLEEFGVRREEIATMFPQEIRAKVLEGLEATGDPKTVGQKAAAAAETVEEGGKALLGLPGKIASMKAAWDDASKLVKAKNDNSYHGRKDRGFGATLYHAMRGDVAHETSFGSVRQVALDKNPKADPATLPRSAADRARLAAGAAGPAKRAPGAAIERPVLLPPAWVAQVSGAPDGKLAEMLMAINQKSADPLDKAKLEFIDVEVAMRTSKGKA